MTTKAKRERKKLNRLAKMDRLAMLLDEIDNMTTNNTVVFEKRERPASEKAAAMTALSAVKKLKKRVKDAE